MSKKSGVIVYWFRDSEVSYGIMYHADQRPEFKAKGYVLVTRCSKDLKPELDTKGNPIKVLKKPAQMLATGYID